MTIPKRYPDRIRKHSQQAHVIVVSGKSMTKSQSHIRSTSDHVSLVVISKRHHERLFVCHDLLKKLFSHFKLQKKEKDLVKGSDASCYNNVPYLVNNSSQKKTPAELRTSTKKGLFTCVQIPKPDVRV